MKIAVALVVLGLLQACGSMPAGKKMDQGGRYMQSYSSGSVDVQIDFPTARACSDDLRASETNVNLTCSLASSANTLTYKGSLNRPVIGEKYPLHFVTQFGCGAYKIRSEALPSRDTVSCDY